MKSPDEVLLTTPFGYKHATELLACVMLMKMLCLQILPLLREGPGQN